MKFKELFEKVYSKIDLSMEESKAVLFSMLEESWEPSQVSAFLTALHMKGETAEELAGFATAMREKAVPVPSDGRLALDTCGTGGDRKGTFNISTLAAFVLAGCGIPIVKHGNRAASSACGSADLLEALGMRYRLTPEEVPVALDCCSFAFLFAPDYHPATKSVVPIRKQLGTPTIFNLLGPLTNPALPFAQLIGVYDRDAVSLMADAIRMTDPTKRVILLHSFCGVDEATLEGEFLLHPTFKEPSVESARTFGFVAGNWKDIHGGSPSENSATAISILEGEKGSRRETVLLNALLGYMAFYPETTPEQARETVRESLDSGAAFEVVTKYKDKFPL